MHSGLIHSNRLVGMASGLLANDFHLRLVSSPSLLHYVSPDAKNRPYGEGEDGRGDHQNDFPLT